MPDADFVLECLSMSAFLKTGKSQSIAYHWCRCWLRGSGFWQQSKFFGCTNQVGQRLDLHFMHDPGAMDFDGFSTVPSSKAIRLFGSPRATRAITSRSRAVNFSTRLSTSANSLRARHDRAKRERELVRLRATDPCP